MTARKASLSLNGCGLGSGQVESYVFRPLHIADLCPPTRTSNDDLRRAMELDKRQFESLILGLRTLAKRTLEVVPWDQQDIEKRELFIAKACEDHPILLKKYEDAWPIEVYMSRFFKMKVRQDTRNRSTRSGHKRQGGAERNYNPSAMWTYVTKPFNMRQLHDPEQSTMRDLQKAMQCGWSDFEKMRVLLQELIHNNLDMDQPYDKQDRYLKGLFVKKAREAEPLFATRYEGEWPIHTYATWYLRHSVLPGFDRITAFRKTDDGEFSEGSNWNAPDQYHRLMPPAGCALHSAPAQASSSTYTSVPQDIQSASVDVRRCVHHSSPPISPVANTQPRRVWSPPTSLSSPAQNEDVENIPLFYSPPAAAPTLSSPHPSDPVREFLRAVKPNLEHLLGRFENIGVKDQESLLVMKSWPRDYQERFLRPYLSPFHVAAVQFLLLNTDS